MKAFRSVFLLPLLLSSIVRADEAQSTVEQSTVEIDRTSEQMAEARLTLALDDAPLLQILHLLSQTGAAKFRYGAPPDAVVSVKWNDESPLKSLGDLVKNAGWQLTRDGGDFFVLPQTGSTRGAWMQWMGSGALPRSEYQVAAPVKVAIKGGGAIDRKSVALSNSQWRPLSPALDSRRTPAISVAMPWENGSVWLRAVLPLVAVPRGTRLMLESQSPCDVFINGAPVARGWSGLRTFDVEPLLLRGTNALVVRWMAPKDAPLLRYEWLFASGAQSGGLPGETRRDALPENAR
ncbi:MAG TPA: hypothetical protein VF681_15460 [Abditibacteriaceae bacterium]|jgi:hypothetical protein